MGVLGPWSRAGSLDSKFCLVHRRWEVMQRTWNLWKSLLWEKVGSFWRGQRLAGRRPAREYGLSATGIEEGGEPKRIFQSGIGRT